LGLKNDSTHFQTKSFKFLQISHLDFWSVTPDKIKALVEMQDPVSVKDV
jgi:hypothetical protein